MAGGVFHLTLACASAMPCWAVVWFLINTLFVLNAVFARLFRVWYRLFASHKQLTIYRQFFLARTPFSLDPTARDVGLAGLEAFGADNALKDNVSSSVEEKPLTMWFVRRPQLGKSRFLWTFLCVSEEIRRGAGHPVLLLDTEPVNVS